MRGGNLAGVETGADFEYRVEAAARRWSEATWALPPGSPLVTGDDVAKEALADLRDAVVAGKRDNHALCRLADCSCLLEGAAVLHRKIERWQAEALANQRRMFPERPSADLQFMEMMAVEMAESLLRLGPVQEVILYGSVAREESDPRDVDLVAVVDEGLCRQFIRQKWIEIDSLLLEPPGLTHSHIARAVLVSYLTDKGVDEFRVALLVAFLESPSLDVILAPPNWRSQLAKMVDSPDPQDAAFATTVLRDARVYLPEWHRFEFR